MSTSLDLTLQYLGHFVSFTILHVNLISRPVFYICPPQALFLKLKDGNEHDKHAVAVVSIVRRVPVHGNVVAIQLNERIQERWYLFISVLMQSSLFIVRVTYTY